LGISLSIIFFLERNKIEEVNEQLGFDFLV